MTELSRRSFLGALALGGGALTLGVSTGCGGPSQTVIKHADQTGELVANMYVAVKRDGRVAVAVSKAEIGQGVSTAYATLVAEELDLALDTIDVHFADSLPEYRTSVGLQITGGSTSTKEGYLPLRQASAAARQMLVEAAAVDWNVAPSECTTDGGRVLHRATGRAAEYGSLTTKAARRPVPSEPRLKRREDYRLIGTRVARVDVRDKVLGTARFGIDTVVPNMARAFVIHGPVFGASPRAVRADAARSRPGVVGVHAFPFGVAVVAEKYWQARAAAAHVEIDWSPGTLKGLDTEKLRHAVRAYPEKGTVGRDDGNVDDAIAGAPVALEAFYEAPFLAHAPMEPQNCIVHAKDDQAEVWAPCQAPSIVQEFVGDALGIPATNVLVHTTLSGGGFGRRILGDFAAQAALVSKKVGRPVQLIWSRESDTTQGFYRPQTAARMRGAVDAQGRAVAISTHTLGQSILLSSAETVRAAVPGVSRGVANALARSALAIFSSSTVTDMFATEGLDNTVYAVPNLRVAFSPVRTGMPVASWRSVGHSVNGFMMESFIDEMAHAAKRDPYAFRRAALPEGSRAQKVLDAVAALSKWGSPTPKGIFRGIARHESFESEVAEVAEVEIVAGKIRVRRVYCVVACGMAINPDVVRSQIEGAVVFGLSAALHQEITLVDGAVQQDNFDTFPALRMNECPEIIVQIMDSTEPPTGVGEPGLPPIAPAVANAIFAGTGVRLRRLPLQRAWNEAHR